MKILVISNTPWSVDNSFGNSFSNIFEGIPDLKFANIYCRPGAPKNDLDMTYYQITEKSLIKNLLNKSNPSGRIVQQEKEEARLMGLTKQEKCDGRLCSGCETLCGKLESGGLLT